MSLSMDEIIEKSELVDEETYGFQSLIETRSDTYKDCIFCDGTTLMWDKTPCICLDYEEFIHRED